VDRVVIVGGGLAGAEAARALRARGFAGELALVGAEPEPPYDRPPLSKEVLRGDSEGVPVELDWADLRVRLRLGTEATGLRPGLVDTSAGKLPYDGLVVATGSVPVRLPGAAGGRTLRTIRDARELRAALTPGARVVVIGAGWIGAEVATAALRAGAAVTALEVLDEPLAAALPTEIAARTRSWWAGVDLRTRTRVEAVEAVAVHLTGGGVVPADVVVVGVGVRPATAWLAGSDVALGSDGGVLTDARTRTSVPGVVAVGDCAAWESPRYGTRLRVEHWDTALRAPAIAAATLLGAEEVYDPVPYFWSEQFGRTVQTIGLPGLATRWVWREEGASWAACGLLGDRLVAVVAADRHHDAAAARRLLARGPAPGPPADPAVLADPSLPLRSAVA
jgi:3-phenylpropionate/trans-cinnamate dioxygenase ferredoxin reductase component